jgi:tRNA pseudouridine55 synthase
MQKLQESDGFILINKDKDKTSFETINNVKKILQIRKIGHAGTLDKNATGLLIAGINKSTKLLKYFLKLPKKYSAEIYFGIQTNTDDANGVEINKFDGIIEEKKILNEIPNFIGEINQTPPLYSAVHVNGQRAYKMAMKNQNPLLSEKKIVIKKIDILSFNNPILKIDIECSSGTYIRSLARDLGIKTGYNAYLFSLKRSSIAGFNVEESFTLEKIKSLDFQIISPFEALDFMPAVDIKEEFIKSLLNGILINQTWFNEDLGKIKDLCKIHFNKKLLAIIKNNNGNFTYDLVY